MSLAFKNRLIVAVAVISSGFVGIASMGCHSAPESSPGDTIEPEVSQVSVERGEYLVQITGCHDCHTPFVVGPNGPEPDMTRMLSGHPQDLVMPPPPQLPEGPWVWLGAGTNTAFSGPWGISYAINLTPHQNTGIGIWTEEMFVDSIRKGRHMGHARPVLPPMPWPAYRHMTDEDLESIFAYLKSIPEIENRIPEAIVAGTDE
jgi:hypothetical protein